MSAERVEFLVPAAMSSRVRWKLWTVLVLVVLLAWAIPTAIHKSTAVLTSHAPILIKGDSNFTSTNGVTGGNGSLSNPYLISGWDINLAQGGQYIDCAGDLCIFVCSSPYCTGIQVENTRAYFAIQNVSIHSGYLLSLDVSFSNVTNGALESSSLAGYSGMNITGSSYVTVSNDNVTMPPYNPGQHSGPMDGPGLQVDSSNHVIIMGDSFTDWENADMQFTRDNNMIISNNSFVGSSSINNSQALDMTNLVNSTIENNQVIDTDIGFTVENGGSFSGNTVSGNVFTGKGHFATEVGIMFWPQPNSNNFIISTQLSSNVITTDNLVEGRPIYYFEDCSGTNINGVSVGELLVANCSNFQASNLSFDGSAFEDIVMFSVHGGSVTNSNLDAAVLGLLSWNSDHIIVSGNNVTAGNGIQFYNTNNMLVFHNNFRNCYIYCNSQYVSGMDSHSGTVNSNSTTTTGSNNHWDNGYPSGGNFWYEYPGVDNCSGPQQNICPSPDGVGDTSFGLDQYPLMQPFIVATDPPATSAGGGGGTPPRFT